MIRPHYYHQRMPTAFFLPQLLGVVTPGAYLAIGLLVGLTALVIFAVWRDCQRTGQVLAVYLAFRVLWPYCKLLHDFRPRGPDPLPPQGPAILIANHTSPADPLFLQCATRRLISFLMAREYYNLTFVGWIFRLNDTIPVNRTGRDTAATKAAVRALHEGRAIGIFPEGGINLDPDTLREGKQGAAMLALLTRAPVIPAFIERRVHTNHLTAGLLRPSKACIHFGRAVDLSPYYDRRHDREVLEEVTRLLMRSIEQLRPKPGEW